MLNWNCKLDGHVQLTYKLGRRKENGKEKEKGEGKGKEEKNEMSRSVFGERG